MSDKKKYRIIRREGFADEQRSGGAYSIKRLGTISLENPATIGIYETTIPPHSCVACHGHATLEEFLTFQTPARMTIEGENVSLEKGDVVYLPPYTMHAIYADDSEVILNAFKLPENPNDKIIPQ